MTFDLFLQGERKILILGTVDIPWIISDSLKKKGVYLTGAFPNFTYRGTCKLLHDPTMDYGTLVKRLGTKLARTMVPTLFTVAPLGY